MPKFKPHIPIADDLVYAGDPKYKLSAEEKTQPLDALSAHIDDIENAIGQDADSPAGRAYAIRIEEQRKGIKSNKE